MHGLHFEVNDGENGWGMQRHADNVGSCAIC